jgi:hypothetical protein
MTRNAKLLNITICCCSLLLCTQLAYVQANDSTSDSGGDTYVAAQKLGAQTRAQIARLSVHNADVTRMLKLQADGDSALREDNSILAAERYGQVEEGVTVLDRERMQAANARSIVRQQIEHAQKLGAGVATANTYEIRGDQAFANGDYAEAEANYAMARADIASSENATTGY